LLAGAPWVSKFGPKNHGAYPTGYASHLAIPPKKNIS
jgi:hypothetical protein